MKKIIDSKKYKSSTPAGHILFCEWFHESRELFTKVVYKKSPEKPSLESMGGFIKVVENILAKVDTKVYGNGVKMFLTDYIKYAPRTMENFNEKQQQLQSQQQQNQPQQ